MWGVDEKLVLDRTDFTKIDNGILTDHTVYHLHIAGWQYDFFYKNGKFIYGEEIHNYYPKEKKKRWRWYLPSDERKGKGIYIPHFAGRTWESLWMYTERIPSSVNDHFGVPILLKHYSGKLEMDKGYRSHASFISNPILKDLDFHKAVPPEDMWLLLCEWLSKQKDKSIVDNQTDKQKIVGKGFDLVKSFRHRK